MKLQVGGTFRDGKGEMNDELAAMRRAYGLDNLDESTLADDWLTQFQRWFAEVVAGGAQAGVVEPNAMVLATADRDARPSTRTVLLKGLDAGGFVFYSHGVSRKGRQLAANPHASLLFPWYGMQRQVSVVGEVERIDDRQADAYFASRPYGSRIGALASPQSTVIPGRSYLDARAAELVARHPRGSVVPRPPGWGGYRVRPGEVEFWQGRENRLHDRIRYRHGDDGWVVERLAP